LFIDGAEQLLKQTEQTEYRYHQQGS